ncbi:MAG: threonine/serine exporter family protein [Myxococcota bacterium]
MRSLQKGRRAPGKGEPAARSIPIGHADLDDGLAFALRLVQVLLAHGVPVHRVQEAASRAAIALGFEIVVFAVPTGAFITLGRDGEFRTRVVPSLPVDIDLERLAAIHTVLKRVEHQSLDPAAAILRIDTLIGTRSRYGALSTLFGFGMASLSFSMLLRGGWVEMCLGGGFGLFVGSLTLLAARSDVIARLLPAIAALAISTMTAIAGALITVRPEILLLSALVILLPGLSLTDGVIELATGNLLSGTARIMGATVTFLQMGFGALLGQRLAVEMPQAAGLLSTPPAEAWGLLVPILASLAFVCVLKIGPKDVPWVFIAVFTAIGTVRTLGPTLGPEIGALLGGFTVALLSHFYVRKVDRPAVVVSIPGILILVPGTMGFLTLSSLLESDVVGAVNTAFSMLMVAMAIATGVLVATLAYPPRRAL